MAFDVEAMIGWMLSNVGYVEDDSGNTPWSDRWGYPGGAWCGMYYQSGVEAGGGTVDDSTGTVPHTELTNTGAILFHEWGQWTTVPHRGSAVYFDWQGSGLSEDPDFWSIDHIGAVVDASGWPEYVETVEGNINNSVVNTIRYNDGRIVGFGRPRGVTPPAPVQPPIEVPTYEIEDEAMNVFVGGNGQGRWFLQAGGNLVPVSKGDVVLKARPAVNVIYCSDEFIKRLAKALPVVQ